MKNVLLRQWWIYSRLLLSTLFLVLLYTASLAQYSPLPDSPRPGDGKGWLDNGQVKIAVNLNYGGAITYFSKSSSNTNTVNNFDKGRQVQIGVYSDPDSYSAGSPIPRGLNLDGIPSKPATSREIHHPFSIMQITEPLFIRR